MRLAGRFAALAVAVFAFGPALGAEPAFKSDDLLQFMLNSVDASATRGVCVGSPQECEAMSKPQGFDMLVTFELNSATLTQDAMVNLTEVSRALLDERLRGIRFEVDGYTDASGSATYNAQLSERRADSVAQFLISLGVGADQLVPVGYGESSPRVPDPYDPLNRRVEIRLSL
jgi:outer membrane protein OmpA-like peptidoglycan-associated protein